MALNFPFLCVLHFAVLPNDDNNANRSTELDIKNNNIVNCQITKCLPPLVLWCLQNIIMDFHSYIISNNIGNSIIRNKTRITDK